MYWIRQEYGLVEGTGGEDDDEQGMDERDDVYIPE
jgi:hypothetical protein